MAILSTQAVAATVSKLRERVRRIVGDANTVRWSNTAIDDSIDDSLRWMHNEMLAAFPDGFSTYADLTYTGGASSEALPAAISSSRILRVLDVTEDAQQLDFVYAEKLDNQNGWSIVSGELALRPKPSGDRTLRIYYLTNFVPVTGAATPATDQHNLLVNFEELIVLDAALRLLEIDRESDNYKVKRLDELKLQFLQFAAQYIGPSDVQRVTAWR